MKEEIVKKLNPKYIGFLLNLYKPFSLNLVFSEGTPRLVELPKLIRLIRIISKPIDANVMDKMFRDSMCCSPIFITLKMDKIKTIQVM